MKYVIFIFIAVFIVVFVPFSHANIVAYAKTESIEEELESEVEEGLNSLISGDLESFFNSLNVEDGTSFRELVERILNGEIVLSVDNVFQLILNAVKDNVFSLLASFITIMLLSMLYGLFNGITSGFAKNNTKQIVYFAIYGAIIAILSVILKDVISTTKQLVDSITTLFEIAFPILLTLVTALGGSVGMQIMQPITLVFSEVILKLINNLILPIFIATIIFTVIGNLSDSVKLEKLTKALKSVASWTLGVAFGVMTTIISLQGIVGASIDTIALRSAKFALSSYVPILGGYLSEGFDIVLAGCVLIKNSMGLAFFLLLITILIGPLVKIVLTSLLMKLVAGLVEPMSDVKISSLLFNTANNLNILISIVLGVTFLCFVIILIVISSFNMGVV